MPELSKHTRMYREKLLADPYRPGYHFAIPDGDGRPGDPNGAFFADGRYHLMYLYRSEITNRFQWGHISSHDLLHWRHHPDALMEGTDSFEGYFSGGGFVDDDGTAYISFWAFPSEKNDGGIGIAYSKPPYEVWEQIDPIPIEGNRNPWGTKTISRDGITEHISCADPSNIWKKDGWYYMQCGNLPVLDAWGRKADSEAKYQGDWTDLFRSKDMKNWEHVQRFYENPHPGEDWPDASEDDMCPSFLQLPDKAAGGELTDKWFQLFISHNKGAQYYIGELKGEKFYPEQHGRFSWVDNTCFAPEALIDPRNRLIGWFWLLDNPSNEGGLSQYEWTGVYSFPRVFWLENGTLHMAPAEELDRLQYNHQSLYLGVVDKKRMIDVKNGASFRLKATIKPNEARKIGFIVRADDENGEYTEIYVDRLENALVMDTSKSGLDGRKTVEKAPLKLGDDDIYMDIFVDKSVIEVYVNNVQAICRRVYPTDVNKATKVYAISDGADYRTVNAWEMMETNMY
ncbi:MAG: glycoside hydrolase family 32 protein [Chloroflexi bacterium]|nr:glycoside hydrolase family 32 protein [Chloroflexota bacterium]